MAKFDARNWLADARHIQLVALASLLTIQFTTIDFGARPEDALVSAACALATQFVASRLVGGPFDWRSPALTGMSLSLLLRAGSPAWLALGAVVAIGSKYLLRVDGRHVFNPSGFAIVALIAAGAPVWVSPGQWGAGFAFAAFAATFAALILTRAKRLDVTLAFLAAFAALAFARAFWLGDPLTIPLHQLSTGSLLVFAFFMISDPPTTPRARRTRLLFACLVAVLAHGLIFYAQLRPALYFALIALSPLTPLLDRWLPAPRFAWREISLEGVRT